MWKKLLVSARSFLLYNSRNRTLQAKVVRQMYKWYAEEGFGGAKIVNMLNERDFKPNEEINRHNHT